MKTIVIGDIHGRTIWKDIVLKEQNSSDKIVFIGDYFDTHEDISQEQQINNFRDLIQFKADNDNKVILLLGNHDFHYLENAKEQYSGYTSKYANIITVVLETALAADLVQICYVYDKYIFTHAGISKTWVNSVLGSNKPDLSTLEQSMNSLFKEAKSPFRFTPGEDYNPYGDEITQTPIWIGPKSLLSDILDDCIQVVGHTTVDYLGIGEKLIQIDCLGTSGEYLTILDGVSIASRI